MPAGINKAKSRRSSRNKQKGRNAWQQANKPAKAGKRKQYGPTSKRKTKDWSGIGNGYRMKDSTPDGRVCADRWSDGEPVMVPKPINRVQDRPQLTEAEHKRRIEALLNYFGG